MAPRTTAPTMPALAWTKPAAPVEEALAADPEAELEPEAEPELPLPVDEAFRV